MKLSHSRMPSVRAYFRETQEPVSDAHDKAFELLRRHLSARHLRQHEDSGGERSSWARRANIIAVFSRCVHIIWLSQLPAKRPHRVGRRTGRKPVSAICADQGCSRPKPRVSEPGRAGRWLVGRLQCIAYAKRHKHPESQGPDDRGRFSRKSASPRITRTIRWFWSKRPSGLPPTCLIMADHNRYSVDARAAGRMVRWFDLMLSASWFFSWRRGGG